ncbi:MAG: hypothetical protein CBB77_09735 [Hyphomonas sp. TMED17]|nr:MAG: hypothetical protein CBB77_09735 [Hyphomonas sp. TMED17]
MGLLRQSRRKTGAFRPCLPEARQGELKVGTFHFVSMQWGCHPGATINCYSGQNAAILALARAAACQLHATLL